MVERPLATVRDEVIEATRDAVRASAGGGDDA
jgi:hypothetical protein